MIPIGYLYKSVEKRRDWVESGTASDIYSLSGCISQNFTEYIGYWKHNGFWLFDAPAIMEEIATEHGIDLSGSTLFFYEAYECEYNEHTGEWSEFAPEPSFATDVVIPRQKQLEGFDVVTFSGHTSPECSPLSCNSLAAGLPVNEHCLFATFAEAKQALEQGAFARSEPGPFRIIAVYTVGIGQGV